jgi:hypothetical protein
LVASSGEMPGLGTRLDRFLQTVGDRQSLPGDTHTLELLGPGLGLGLGDHRIFFASALFFAASFSRALALTSFIASLTFLSG